MALWEREWLLGDWGGARTAAAERGLSTEFLYTGELFSNLRGGMRHGGIEYRADLSLYFELDTAEAGWWDGGAFFMHVQGEHGDSLTSRYVGDFQFLSSIDADDFFQISEFWYQHTWFDERLRLKLGKIDANGEFASPEFGGEFVHSGTYYSPTIPIVTYEDPDLGVMLEIAPWDWFSVRAGVFNGNSDGGRAPSRIFEEIRDPFAIVEPAFHISAGGLEGCLRLGWWRHGSPAEHFLTFAEEEYGALPRLSEPHGWYAVWDQELWLENPDDAEDAQGIGLFVQYGWAQDSLSEADRHVGVGIQWTGALPGRDDDILGLVMSRVEFSRWAGFDELHETAFEIYYKVQVLGWLSLKPDLQYITHPGGSNNPNALAAGVRIEISF